MVKVIGINGSPRKIWNSATVLEEALKGAAICGAETERIDLFDLKYSGCLSCFSCKRLGGKSFARCALQDDLTSILEKILSADAVIISAPIYYGDVPGAVRNLYERLLFPANLYSADQSTGYEKRIPTGLIYTMGAPDPKFNGSRVETDRTPFEIFIGPVETLNITDTLQFDDYSKYTSSIFDPNAKQRHREEVFPEECQKAFALGQKIVTMANKCKD